MSDFVSLVDELEGWFDSPFADLPDAIRERIKLDFFPMPWGKLSAEQRRSVAHQWDYNHDPTTEAEREYWWDFFDKKAELEKQIEQWRAVAAPTASELAEKERRLKELADELARMERVMKHGRGDYLVEAPQVSGPDKQGRYIAYPKALYLLQQRLKATPEELAAWIFLGPEKGGIAAYRNANELKSPPRFYFAHFMGEDYVAPMMGCWFLAEDVERFSPADRYMTGTALIERWSAQAGIVPKAFIQAKIEESRLIDLHPIYGATRGTISEDKALPPLETGLFVLAHVEAIEAEDFGLAAVSSELHLPRDTATSRTTTADLLVPKPRETCAVFVAMENLTSDELSITFVGDKIEAGVGANGMLEISARGETRRLPCIALDLINRNNGALNSQGVAMLGLAQGRAIPGTEANRKKVSRLREALRVRLGICDDPFEAFQQGKGWQPRFKVTDRRGDADERAKRQAERRTISLDHHIDYLDVDKHHDDLDEWEDEAAAWLRDHDSAASADK